MEISHWEVYYNSMKYQRIQLLIPVFMLLTLSLFSKGQREEADDNLSQKSEIILNIPQFSILISEISEETEFFPGRGDPEMMLFYQLFEGLVLENPESGDIEAALAEDWEFLEEGQIIRFRLKTVLWSDGTPVTAEDFRTSWLRMLELEERTAKPFLSLFIKDDGSEALRVLSDKTLEIEFNRPYPFALRLLCEPSFFLYPPSFFDLVNYSPQLLATVPSSSAYAINPSFSEDQSFHLTKRKNYHENRGPEILKFTECSSEEALSLFTAAKAQWLTSYVFPVQKLSELEYRYDFSAPSGRTSYFYILNRMRSPLGNSALRRELTEVVDTELLIKDLLRGPQQPAYSLIPGSFYKEEAGSVRWPVEPEEKFKAAGRERPLIFIYPGEEGHRKVAEYLIALWNEKSGIPVEGMSMDWLDFLRARDRGEYDIALGGWTAQYNDPHSFLSLFLTGSLFRSPGSGNNDFDKLILEAELLPEGAAREKIQYEAESLLLHRDNEVLPLFFTTFPQLLNTREFKGLGKKPSAPQPLKFLHN